MHAFDDIHSDHSSLTTALGEYPEKETVEEGVANGDDVHVLGVVGIFFDVVEDRINPAFDVIFTDATSQQIHYPDDGAVQTTEIVNGLDLSDLIPSDISTSGYYAYEGSLSYVFLSTLYAIK